MIKPKTIALVLIPIILVALILFYPAGEPQKDMQYSAINISSLAVAGNQGYVTYSSAQGAQVYLLALNKKPIKTVYVLEREEGIGLNNLGNFMEKLNSLSSYGIEVSKIFSLNEIGNDAFVIIPQGAMPESALGFLDGDITILYIGKTDILYKNGAIQNDWYFGLEDSKKEKIILYNFSLDELYSQGLENELIDSIIFNKWSQKSSTSKISKEGIQTIIVPFDNATYLRFIYPYKDGFLFQDSQQISKSGHIIEIDPAFPDETRYVYMNLENSKGVPHLLIFLEGEKILEETLGTLEQDVFFKSLSFNQSGDYIIRIQDHTGEIASGIFHIYDLDIEYEGSRDFFQDFYITLDLQPVSSQTAKIWISEPDDYLELSVYSGKLSVPAKLKQGENIIHIQLYGKTFEKIINYQQQNIFDIYLSYGPFVVLAIIILYLFIIFTKKQPYRIKFDSGLKLTCGEVKIKSGQIKKILSRSIQEFGVGGCITPKEFSLSLKKYITDGYDVLDGNAEAVLKYFEKKGYLCSYKSYYSLNEKQDIQRIVMNRLIREKLIENGVSFLIKNEVFQTKNYLLVFGPRFPKTEKKTILVFENSKMVSDYLESLGQKQGAETAIKIRNNTLLFLGLEELADYL
ncbi:MAG: hypothetical protein WC501_00775 [Candidatus Micrarchaeia archaeon]